MTGVLVMFCFSLDVFSALSQSVRKTCHKAALAPESNSSQLSCRISCSISSVLLGVCVAAALYFLPSKGDVFFFF